MASTTNGEQSAYDYLTQEWAIEQDSFDALREFRLKFHVPTINDLKSPKLGQSLDVDTSSPSIYLCGNSLGLQPKQTAEYVNNYLTQWRRKAVLGHFVEYEDSLLAPFLHIDDHAAKLMAPIVGALEHEVAVMGTLTGNLHLLMSSFYQPDRTAKGRYKIMLEGKAFPSDHFAVESQIVNHGLDPKDAMVLLEPEDSSRPILSTEQILQAIDHHADQLALLLLPGIQFYTGQYFDMKTITAHAQSRGIMVGWDCAHAVGNVDLQLHDWNVDFAVWCSYKYLNTGPGGMAGIFVHDKYGVVSTDKESPKYRPRLSGWWGDDKKTRFQMTNNFIPRAGAAGYQLSNPSGIDLAAVVASLQIFNQTSMTQLRKRSMRLTQFLEDLLNSPQIGGQNPAYSIITPQDPLARGAQLSVRLKPGFLDSVLEVLEENGVVIDERKPDVIRVAPAPLYNTFEDVWNFCKVFRQGLDRAQLKHQ